MSISNLLWFVALIIGVIVVSSKYASISVPFVTPVLMTDVGLTLLVALVCALASRWL